MKLKNKQRKWLIACSLTGVFTLVSSLFLTNTNQNIITPQNQSNSIVKNSNKNALNTTIKPTFIDSNPTNISVNYEQLESTVGKDKDKFFAIDWNLNYKKEEYGNYVMEYINKNIPDLLDGITNGNKTVEAQKVEILHSNQTTDVLKFVVTFDNWFVDNTPTANKKVDGLLSLKPIPLGEKFEVGINEELKRNLNYILAVGDSFKRTDRIKEVVANYFSSRNEDLPNSFLNLSVVYTSQISCTTSFKNNDIIIIKDLYINQAEDKVTEVRQYIKIRYLKIDSNSVELTQGSQSLLEFTIIGIVGLGSLILLLSIAWMIKKKNMHKTKEPSSFIGRIDED